MPVCLFLATACIDSYANKRSIEINIGERNGTRTNCSTIEIPTAVSRYASPLAYLKLTGSGQGCAFVWTCVRCGGCRRAHRPPTGGCGFENLKRNLAISGCLVYILVDHNRTNRGHVEKIDCQPVLCFLIRRNPSTVAVDAAVHGLVCSKSIG
jgi:hypothetical protein